MAGKQGETCAGLNDGRPCYFFEAGQPMQCHYEAPSSMNVRGKTGLSMAPTVENNWCRHYRPEVYAFWYPITTTGIQPWVAVGRGPVGIALVTEHPIEFTVEIAKGKDLGSTVAKYKSYTGPIEPPDIYEATEAFEWLRFNVTSDSPNAMGRFSQ